MNELKLEKIKRFVNDEAMFEAVFEQIQETFTKKKANNDVHILAATTLSLYNLDEARRDLVNLRDKQEAKQEKTGQVGM